MADVIAWAGIHRHKFRPLVGLEGAIFDDLVVFDAAVEVAVAKSVLEVGGFARFRVDEFRRVFCAYEAGFDLNEAGFDDLIEVEVVNGSLVNAGFFEDHIRLSRDVEGVPTFHQTTAFQAFFDVFAVIFLLFLREGLSKKRSVQTRKEDEQSGETYEIHIRRL
ncbi:MAG: hypothetical protein AAF570_08040 [Bacteroidota bacterium]